MSQTTENGFGAVVTPSSGREHFHIESYWTSYLYLICLDISISSFGNPVAGAVKQERELLHIAGEHSSHQLGQTHGMQKPQSMKFMYFGRSQSDKEGTVVANAQQHYAKLPTIFL